MENGFRLAEFMARVFRTRLECRFPRDRCVCEGTYQGTACAYSLREMDGASYHAASVDDSASVISLLRLSTETRLFLRLDTVRYFERVNDLLSSYLIIWV